MNVTTLKEAIIKNVESNKEAYLSTSHAIHAKPKIGNEEFFAPACLQIFLKKKVLQ